MTLTDPPGGLGIRLVGLIRHVALAGLAAAITGGIVLGVGGRLVMFISRLIHPEASGRITENGNRIGEFTIQGSIELLVFGGVLSGLLAGVIWVLIRRWLPGGALVVGLGAVSIGGPFLIEGDNRDFVILEDPRLDLLLLLGLLFLFGLSLHWVDRLLTERTSEEPRTSGIVFYSLMLSLGAPLMIPTFGFFFSQEFCFCSSPPIWTGIFLTAASLATVTWWIRHLRGAQSPSPPLTTIGLVAVSLTAVAGIIDLTTEIIHIL